jgi:predicted lipoprotein with Yx(FWY)xxD motif
MMHQLVYKQKIGGDGINASHTPYTLVQHPQSPTEIIMNTTRIVVPLFAAALLAASSSYATQPAAPAIMSGDMLTGGNGMTLYTFDKDAAGSGKSVCNGPCAANWPPLYVMSGESGGGDYSIVMREDGKQQWAFKGKPLYFWSKDQKPGDKTGDGFNNVWRVAKP